MNVRPISNKREGDFEGMNKGEERKSLEHTGGLPLDSTGYKPTEDIDKRESSKRKNQDRDRPVSAQLISTQYTGPKTPSVSFSFPSVESGPHTNGSGAWKGRPPDQKDKVSLEPALAASHENHPPNCPEAHAAALEVNEASPAMDEDPPPADEGCVGHNSSSL